MSPVLAGLAGDVLDPWSGAIMGRALVEVVLLGVTGGLLGVWITAYGLTFSAEALPHSMFPGLVGAALLGLPLALGGAVGLAVAALAITVASRLASVDRSTAVSVVYTTLFGLGVLMALSPEVPASVQDLLFGDILGLTGGDLAVAGGLAAVVVASLAVLHPRLAAVAFDRDGAPALGLRPTVVDVVLVLLVAVAVLVSVQALGNLFVVAALVAPAAAARRAGLRLVPTILLAAGIAVGAGIAGLYVSYYANTAAGASIAGATVLAYLAIAGAAAIRDRVAGRRAAAA